MIAIDQIITEISPMRPLEKIKLVDKILKSLNQPNHNIDKIWQDEAEARIKGYEENEIDSVSAEEVFKRYQK